jgi:hypothetical protein
MKSVNKFLGISLVMACAVAGSLPIASQADEIVSVPFSLSNDLVRLVGDTTYVTVNAAGDLIDSSGKVIGIVSGLDSAGRVVVRKEVPSSVIIVKQDTNAVYSASLYNRMAAIDDMLNSELAVNHVSKDSYDSLKTEVANLRSDLSAKIASDNFLSFDEATEVGAKLDSLAAKTKVAISGVDANLVVFRPMVYSEGSSRRIAVYTRKSVSTDGGSTVTTTTETKEVQ